MECFSDDFETRWSGTVSKARRPGSNTKMNTKLYVGNLSFDATENDLQDLFAQHGPVTEVNLMQDRATGRARGFGFVTMATEAGASSAVQSLNGKEWKGRALTVNEARPREQSFRGGGGRSRPREERSNGGSGGGYRSRRY